MGKKKNPLEVVQWVNLGGYYRRTGTESRQPTIAQLITPARNILLTTISHCARVTTGSSTRVNGDLKAGTALMSLNCSDGSTGGVVVESDRDSDFSAVWEIGLWFSLHFSCAWPSFLPGSLSADNTSKASTMDVRRGGELALVFATTEIRLSVSVCPCFGGNKSKSNGPNLCLSSGVISRVES